MLGQASLAEKYRMANLDRHRLATEMMADCCRDAGINIQALTGGSRQRQVSKIRSDLAWRLTDELGFSYAEAARMLGISTSAIARIKYRKDKSISLSTTSPKTEPEGWQA